MLKKAFSYQIVLIVVVNVAGFKKLRYLELMSSVTVIPKKRKLLENAIQVCGTKSVAECHKRPMLRQANLIMLINELFLKVTGQAAIFESRCWQKI